LMLLYNNLSSVKIIQ